MAVERGVKIARLRAWVPAALLLLTGCGEKRGAFVPVEAWPGHDESPPHLLDGPLWVGWDARAEAWRYLRVPGAAGNPGGRGLVDPGDPATWKGDTGLFLQGLDQLPSGTHMNMRWNPATAAHRHQVDDVMIRVGSSWIDKYEARVVDVSTPGAPRWIDDPEGGGAPAAAGFDPGTAYSVPPTWLAGSKRARGTTGVTWFVAARAAANAGKRLATNEEWQVAVSGTRRSDATGMQPDGETWEQVEDRDVSALGVVGGAGSLWEWTQAWGQWGQHYDGAPQPWLDWPGAGSFQEWDERWSGYGDDYAINVAGRAFTRQGAPRYATGLPAALVRGGGWGDHARAGVFALVADGAPSYAGREVGFRCAR